jgi:hypothetical protein
MAIVEFIQVEPICQTNEQWTAYDERFTLPWKQSRG